MRFRLLLTQEAYAFLSKLNSKVQDKIYYNIHRVRDGEINKELFKKLDGSDIWEFRTTYNGVAYRLFAFWDTDNETIVVATHGIVKKRQKTPAREIAKAESVRKSYFENQRK